jgi:hypothetical protein
MIDASLVAAHPQRIKDASVDEKALLRVCDIGAWHRSGHEVKLVVGGARALTLGEILRVEVDGGVL